MPNTLQYNLVVMHSFGVDEHFTSKIFAKGLKSRKNEDEKTFNVSFICIHFSFVIIPLLISFPRLLKWLRRKNMYVFAQKYVFSSHLNIWARFITNGFISKNS